jgi:hypothetical protein
MRMPFLLMLCCAPAALAAQEAYPTIERAPATPFSEAPPAAENRPRGEEEYYDRTFNVTREEARRRARLRREIADEIGALRARLEAEQADNFAELWIQHAPEWRIVVAFVREPEATLRLYTQSPHFEARQVPYSMAELNGARDAAFAELARLGIPAGGGVHAMENVVKIGVALGQDEVDAMLADGRLRASPMVQLIGQPPLGEAAAVAPEARRFLRIFPQAERRTGDETEELNTGTIVLRDGCLRLDRTGPDDPVAFFGAETGVRLDAEGRLILHRRGAASGPTGRVGERMVLGGGAGRAIDDPEVLAPIRAACGDGPVIWVGNPYSFAVFREQNAAWRIDEEARQTGATREAAWRRLRTCWIGEDQRYEQARLERPPTAPPAPPPQPCDLPPAPPPRR